MQVSTQDTQEATRAALSEETQLLGSSPLPAAAHLPRDSVAECRLGAWLCPLPPWHPEDGRVGRFSKGCSCARTCFEAASLHRYTHVLHGEVKAQKQICTSARYRQWKALLTRNFSRFYPLPFGGRQCRPNHRAKLHTPASGVPRTGCKLGPTHQEKGPDRLSPVRFPLPGPAARRGGGRSAPFRPGQKRTNPARLQQPSWGRPARRHPPPLRPHHPDARTCEVPRGRGGGPRSPRGPAPAGTRAPLRVPSARLPPPGAGSQEQRPPAGRDRAGPGRIGPRRAPLPLPTPGPHMANGCDSG